MHMGVMSKIKPFAALLIVCFIWTADAPAGENPSARIDKGIRLLHEKNYTGAFDLFDAIDAGSSEWLKARVAYMGGYALFKSGRYREAADRLSTVTDNLLFGDYALLMLDLMDPLSRG